MPTRPLNQDDPLDDFEHRQITLEGATKLAQVVRSVAAVIALTMMLEPAMLAPVLSQPTLPLNDPAGMHIAPDELAAVRDRLRREDLTVMAYRFDGDRYCTAQRFAAYAEALGDRFVARVLPA